MMGLDLTKAQEFLSSLRNTVTMNKETFPCSMFIEADAKGDLEKTPFDGVNPPFTDQDLSVFGYKIFSTKCDASLSDNKAFVSCFLFLHIVTFSNSFEIPQHSKGPVLIQHQPHRQTSSFLKSLQRSPNFSQILPRRSKSHSNLSPLMTQKPKSPQQKRFNQKAFQMISIHGCIRVGLICPPQLILFPFPYPSYPLYSFHQL